MTTIEKRRRASQIVGGRRPTAEEIAAGPRRAQRLAPSPIKVDSAAFGPKLFSLPIVEQLHLCSLYV